MLVAVVEGSGKGPNSASYSFALSLLETRNVVHNKFAIIYTY